ncbi:MAG: glycosyl transferase family 2 [Firmicutes bacterium]|nr:glycosyl transferase family 2 [Bacillota bacterium]
MSIFVSVIIPIVNIEKQLRRCVDSIIRQTYPNLEIILVDHGSTDGVTGLCDDYARKDHRIHVIHTTEGSLSEAKNTGLRVATGDYIYFLDGSDYVVETLLEVALENAIATSADLVIFDYNKIDEFDNLLSPVRFKAALYEIEAHNRLEYIINNLQQYSTGWEVGNRLFKADMIRRNNLFFWDKELILKEDLGFSLNYALYANKISYLPKMLYYYRLQKTSDRAQSPTEPMLTEAIELCKLVDDKIKTSFKGSPIEKELPILLFSFVNEQRSKLHSYNYRNALSSMNDKDIFYRLNRQFIAKPLSFLRYYGAARGIAFLLQCIFIASEKTERIGISIIHMMNKFKKISETFQYNKTKLFSKKRLFLIGCEDFWNLGDHHIAISEIEYLQKILPDYAIVEIAASKYFAVHRLLPLVIRRKDFIFMHGGGNMGNFYMLAEQIRRDLLNRFRENEKVIFPQTIHYDCSDEGKAELEKDQRIIKKSKHLTLCTREHYSYELAKQYFECNVILTPDIVLFSNYSDYINLDRKGVLLLLRNDLEGIITCQDKHRIELVVEQYTLEIRRNDTQLITDINILDRREVLDDFVRKIAESEFVITDRLHGMVFCAITRTPCIVLSNYNHKVKGVYEWLSKLEYIILINQLSELDGAIKKLLQIETVIYDNSTILGEFDILTKLLMSKLQ